MSADSLACYVSCELFKKTRYLMERLHGTL